MTIQIIGSLAVLAGFALSQWGILDPKSVTYLTVNAAGSGILAADAMIEAQWGFLLLEGAWAAVSLISLARTLRPKPVPNGQTDQRDVAARPALFEP
jgi:hypothetical protein